MIDAAREENDKSPLENARARLKSVIAGLPGMEAVETVIRSKLVSDAPLLEEIPAYLLELGGKRMRPVLTLLVARALGQQTPAPALIDVAAGIELIHMATLLHDDIIDNSDMRRHKASPLNRFGQSETLLAGDFLLVRAFSLCARLDAAIIDATERACIHLTEGEILEVPLYATQHSRETALTIADKKTAALFELAAYSAAHIATANPTVTSSMAAFGQALGIAFQILDDILDVTSDADLLGKPSGTDIRERKPSIVNILLL
jgi:octaprenyl-diphosphate synthase